MNIPFTSYCQENKYRPQKLVSWRFLVPKRFWPMVTDSHGHFQHLVIITAYIYKYLSWMATPSCSSAIFMKEHNFCDQFATLDDEALFSFGTTLLGKNLLHMEQILSFKSYPQWKTCWNQLGFFLQDLSPFEIYSFSLIQFQSFCCFRPLTSGEGGKTRLLGKHKRPTQTSRSVASEAKEVATSVRSMIDTQREYLILNTVNPLYNDPICSQTFWHYTEFAV